MSTTKTSVEARVGLRIRALRHQRGITQAELGRKAGCIAPAEVSKFENARRSPSLDSLQRIADALNVPLHELVDVSPGGDHERTLRAVMERLRAVPAERLRSVLNVVNAMLQD